MMEITTENNQLEQLRTAYETEPQSVDAGMRLAQHYTDLGWYNEAIEIYKNLLKSHPNDYTLLLEYGNICYRRKDLKEAVSTFKKLTTLRLDRMEGWNNLGIVLIAMGQHDEARQAFEKVLEIESDNAGALLNMGNYYYSLNNFTKAIELFEHAVKARIDFPDGWFNLGNAYFALNDTEKARNAFEKALKYQREFPSALKNLGFLYEQKGDFVKAEEFYLQASAINKADASLQVNLANCYLHLNKYEEAKKCFLKSVRLAPRDTAGWFGLRHIALLKGDIHTYIRATLAILPRLDDEIIAKSIEILKDLGHVDKAFELLEQADRLNKSGNELDAQRLVLYHSRKLHPGKVASIYKRLSSEISVSDSVKKCIASYSYETGNYEAVVRLLHGIPDPDSVTLSIEWRAHIALGELKSAEQSIKEYLKKHEDFFEGWFLLAKVYAMQGNRENATNCLRAALEQGFTDNDEIKKDPILSLIYASFSSSPRDGLISD